MAGLGMVAGRRPFSISPEQDETNAGMGFNPQTDAPQDPNAFKGMFKHVGYYPGGGLASIGDGIWNAAVAFRMNKAQDEQRASNRAAGETLQKFVSGGGMSQGPDAIAPLFAHPNPSVRGFAAHQLQRWDQQNDPYRKAQIEYLQSRTGLNDTKSDVMQDAKRPVAAPDPSDNYGMDADGNVIQLQPKSSGIQPTGAAAGMTAGPQRFGGALVATGGRSENDLLTPEWAKREQITPADRSSARTQAPVTSGQVPGIVVQDGQTVKSDPLATKELQGQRALASADEEARARYLNEMERRRRNDHVFGKAPSGMRWNDDGSLEDLKDASKKKVGLSKIGELIGDVKTAADVLTKSWPVTRAAAHSSGGWVAPEQEQAMRSVEHAVQFMTAEVEGKRHANAQDVRMLRFFAPAPTDSTEMVGFKLDQLNRIMQGYFGAKEPSGAVFKSLLSQAHNARLAREKAAEGKVSPSAPSPLPKPGPGMTGGPPKTGRRIYDPTTGGFKDAP